MTHDDLAAIRERVEVATAPVLVKPGDPDPAKVFRDHAWDDVPALLDHVAFLELLIHDLREESSAYRRGVEEGAAQEREACAQLVDGSFEASEERLAGMIRARGQS